MKAARDASKTISLTKLLFYCDVSRTAWHYTRSSGLAIDGRMESLIMEAGKAHVQGAKDGGPAH